MSVYIVTSEVLSGQFKAKRVQADSFLEAVEKADIVSNRIIVFHQDDGMKYKSRRSFVVERVK